MSQNIKASITAVEGYVPEFVLTNKELEKLIETSDEWITSRTGIKERRILKDPNKGTSDMAVEAINKLLKQKNIAPEEIDLIICGTITPDMVFPATACLIADKVGAKNAFGYDISAACSSFIYALVTGQKFIESGTHKKVLVCGFDKMSSIINYEDRTTCIIFGDGGGVALLEPATDENYIVDSILKSDGSGMQFLHQKDGGSLTHPSHQSIDARLHYVYQEGQSVFKFAVTNMADVSAEIMERNNLTADDVAWLAPHQANKRIIDATARRMGVGDDKVMLNIHKYGNTTSGTIPLLLWEYENQLKKGDNLIISAFGGGFTWGSIYLKWAY